MANSFDAIKSVKESEVHFGWISIQLEWPLAVHPVWSPDSDRLALILWKVGVYLLDLQTFTLSPVQSWSRRFWGRPLWRGAELLLSAFDKGAWMRLTSAGWQEGESINAPGGIFCPEWIEPAAETLPAVCGNMNGRGWRLVELSLSGELIQEIDARRADGSPLSPGPGYPTWWVPGQSLLVTAHEDQSTWVVDIKSGATTLLPDSPIVRFSRAAQSPVVAGMSPDLPPGQDPEPRVLHALHQETREFYALGEVRIQDAFFTTIATNPRGTQVACIDADGVIHLVPIVRDRNAAPPSR